MKRQDFNRPDSPRSVSTMKSSKNAGKRSSGYSVLDSARIIKKKAALQDLIHKLVPDYDVMYDNGNLIAKLINRISRLSV